MGVFSDSDSSHTCPSITSGPQYGAKHVVGSLTFHDLTRILCGAFTAVVFLVSGMHIMLHATRFSNPGEQVKIIRIIAIVPVFALVYLIAALTPSGAVYFQPWADFYESIALASYFLLLTTFVVPAPERRDAFFDSLGREKGESNLGMYRRTWIFVFQYIPVSFVVAVATDITQATGKYCANGGGAHFAHIWLTVIRSLSVVLAFLRLLAFYRRLRSQLTPYHVLSKLTAIKLIVFIDFIQRIVFTILNSTGAAKPSASLSYNDIYYGIPSILICGEMVLFAFFHFYAYSARPYCIQRGFSNVEVQQMGKGQYFGGFLGTKALVTAMNPMEILKGLGQAVKFLVSSPQAQYRDDNMGTQFVSGEQLADYGRTLPPYTPQEFTAPHPVPPTANVEYGTVDQHSSVPKPRH